MSYTETLGGYGDSSFEVQVLASLYDPHASYSFDTILVFKHDGKLHFERDSGCSCPSPFEDVSPESLKPFSFTALQAGVKDWSREDYDWYADEDKGAYSVLAVPFLALVSEIARVNGVLWTEDGSFT